MRKWKLTGRVVMALLLCALLLTNAVPRTMVYAAYLPNGAPSNLPDDFDGYVSDDYISSGGYVDTGLREGLLDTSHDGIYAGYDTNISGQLNGPKQQNTTGPLGEVILWAWDTVLGNFGIKTDDQGPLADLLSTLIYFLAMSLHTLLDNVGMALDNIIFGRVGGHGTFVGGSTIVSLFHFELEKGNPYGVIAAMIYSLIRKYMYVVMILVAFFSLVKVARNNDIPRAKLEFKERLLSLFQVFGLIVFMPYFLEVGLYVRDIILYGVLGADGMLGLFTNSDIGLLDSFRENCGVGSLGLQDPPIMASILYFAATCVSLVFAFMYVSNAMLMMIQVISFPVVCVKSLFDNKALDNWTWEMVGLSAVPILDGMLLCIPMLFHKAGNGSIGLNTISLISCCCMLTVRQQFRRAVGLQSNNALEARSMMTAMGLARMISSIGRAGKNTIGQIAGGYKQGASDDAMASYYEALDAQDTAKYRDAAAQVDNGFFNSNGGVGENPAARTGMGTAGGLAYKMQKLCESQADAAYEEAHRGFTGEIVDDGTMGVFSVQEGVEHREADVRNEQIDAVLGKNKPVESDPVAKEFANIDNFDSQEFANKLSNAEKARLYRERARTARQQGINSSVATAGGAIVGGMVGFAATAYMDSGTSAMIASAGIDVGASAGSAIKGVSNIRRQMQAANATHKIEGSGVEQDYVITQDKNGTHLETYDKYSKRKTYGEAYEASVDMTDLPATMPAEERGTVRVQPRAEGMYQTNGAQISGPKTDASTGEYYYSVDGAPISMAGSERMAIEQNVEVEATLSPEEARKTDFVTYFNENADLRDAYGKALEGAVRETWTNTKMMATGNTNYKTAEAKSIDAKMKVDITPAEKARVNEDIAELKNVTFSMVSNSVSEPTEAGLMSAAVASGRSLSESEQEVISQQTKEFADRMATEYLKQQKWDFDSLMLE